jgi:signal transduction histidine kinase
LLVVIAGAAVLDGLFLDHPIPAWRQMLFAILAVAAYLHGRHLPVRRDWLLLAGAALPAAAYTVSAPSTGVGALMALGLVVTLPWLAGRFRRQQAALIRAGAERVAQLERGQAFVAEQVRLRERARLAADMHDALGHDLALIALRAGALELAPDMTEPNREAATGLRASAVAATDRLRHTVGLLRADRTAPTQVPGESLDALVDRARDAGMRVHLHRGDVCSPAPAEQAVDPTPAAPETRAVHRVVQEALTNAARHAPGADVEVLVERARDAITVTVRNPITQGPRRPRSSSGTGIAGLRGHVGLLGGTLHAGATHGAFTVTAWLPTRPQTDAPTDIGVQ